MSEDIGWKFPSNDGGTESGFNHSGIEIFSGAPFISLAREVIQNSLDAAKDMNSTKPVTVSFEVLDIPSSIFPGRREFLKTIEQCREASKGEEKAEQFFNNAKKILDGKKIRCLKISDYETTGLRDGIMGDRRTGMWHRLVKATGLPGKQSNTAGGSYGIGKNAPFVISDLRTVFYITRYQDNGKTFEYAQGKSILISHKISDNTFSQDTGFFGWKKDKEGRWCERLAGNDIPNILRRDKQNGTTLLIPALNEKDNWRGKIISAIISNYFHAINQKKLEVLIDPNNKNDVVIDSDTLQEYLNDENLWKIGNKNDVKVARQYYSAIIEGKKIDFTLSILGHCTLRIKVEEGYSKSVAILRRGMKITDSLPKLRQWGGGGGFFRCRHL